LREFRERRRKEGKGGKRKGARGQSPQSPGELSGLGPPRPPQLDRRRLSVFSPATRKKKLVDLSLRDLQPLLPTSQPRGNRAPSTHSRQATVTNRASDFGTSTAASPSILARVGKKGPSLGFSPAKAASASALLPPTNGGSLLDGFPLFAMSKRSKMRKCDDVTSEWKAAGQKKTRQSIFQKGRAEGQPAAKC